MIILGIILLVVFLIFSTRMNKYMDGILDKRRKLRKERKLKKAEGKRKDKGYDYPVSDLVVEPNYSSLTIDCPKCNKKLHIQVNHIDDPKSDYGSLEK